MGGFSNVVPKNYPISPDIEDRRHEHDNEPEARVLPELVIRAKPAFPKGPSYKSVRNERLKKQQ